MLENKDCMIEFLIMLEKGSDHHKLKLHCSGEKGMMSMLMKVAPVS